MWFQVSTWWEISRNLGLQMFVLEYILVSNFNSAYLVLQLSSFFVLTLMNIWGDYNNRIALHPVAIIQCIIAVCLSHCSLSPGEWRDWGWKKTQGVIGTADTCILSWLAQQLYSSRHSITQHMPLLLADKMDLQLWWSSNRHFLSWNIEGTSSSWPWVHCGVHGRCYKCSQLLPESPLFNKTWAREHTLASCLSQKSFLQKLKEVKM